MQVSGGVSSLGSWMGVCSLVVVYQGKGVGWECAGQWWCIKARELDGSVQVSVGVSRLGSWVGVCRSVVVYQV